MSISAQQKTQQVFLSSKHASQYHNTTNHSDLTFHLPRPILKPGDTDIQIKVQQFVAPVSFYNINSTNNTLHYFIDLDEKPLFTIPEGNYTAASLQTALSNELVPKGVTVIYDDDTMKFTFESNATPTEPITFDADSTCLSLLGFTEGEDHDSDEVDGVETLISQYPIDLSPTKALYISIPNLSINNLNGNTGQRTQVIACVPVNEEAGDVVCFNNDLGQSIHTQEDVISEFHIKVLDEDQSTLINFNNQHFLLTIELSFVPTD